MPLVYTEDMLLQAQKGGYAVGAFNVENMEMVQAVLDAAGGLRAPVIIQTTPSTVRYGSLALFYANAAAAAQWVKVPVALHLDHGDSFDLAVRAIREGYTSVMIDGSGEELEKNIDLTSRVVAVAKPSGVPVEAELGKVGGKEDSLETEEGLTVPEEAAEFVRRTGISSLAVSIGTAHGVYKGVPKLDFERLRDIRRLVDIPLVLHGASGLPERDVTACIKEGICKVNYATELRMAYTEGVREVLEKNGDVFDPKAYGKAARANVVKAVKCRIELCGCAGKY